MVDESIGDDTESILDEHDRRRKGRELQRQRIESHWRRERRELEELRLIQADVAAVKDPERGAAMKAEAEAEIARIRAKESKETKS